MSNLFLYELKLEELCRHRIKTVALSTNPIKDRREGWASPKSCTKIALTKNKGMQH